MTGKTIERTVSGDQGRVFFACQRAVTQLGYSVLETNSKSFISFNTGRSMKSWGGQNLNATIISEGGVCRIIVDGSMAQGRSPFGAKQIYDWGEKSALSNKFLDAVQQILQSMAP